MPPNFAPNAGTYNALLTYQSVTYEADAVGQMQPTYATHSQHWCNVRTPNGRESLAAQQQRATVSHVVECHWPGYAFAPDGRLTDGANVYSIVSSFDPETRGRVLFTYAVELVQPAAVNTSTL